jgi:hypothetical protein
MDALEVLDCKRTKAALDEVAMRNVTCRWGR